MIPAPRPAARARLASVPAAILLLALLVAACAAGSGSPTTPAGSTAPASGGPDASPSGPDDPQPSPTNWPSNVVEAVLLLGKADLDIQQGGADLSAAVDAQDPEKMWGAADGLNAVLVKLPSQVDRIRDYPTTTALAAAYDAALPSMLEGTSKLRDAITAGDAAAVQAASQELGRGIAAYAAVRSLLSDAVQQASLMQRILVK